MRSCLSIAASFLLLLASCGGSSSPKVTTVPAEPAAPADDACPMTVAGTSVTVEDTPVGGALVFATTGDVDAVRARVRAWADAHNAHHEAMGPLPTGHEAPSGGGHDHHAHGGHGDGSEHAGHGGGGGHAGHAGHGGGGGGGPMTIGLHSRATAVDIDGGARLELVAFPDQIGAMRDELRAHAQHLAMGHCAMPSGA